MFIDHIGAVFPDAAPLFFRIIGRVAFPVYAYLAAQGCKHTKDINKYLLRLGIFALISEIPFDIAFKQYTAYNQNGISVSFLRNTNVFYTLFLGVFCVLVYERLKHKKRPWIALSALILIPAAVSTNFIPDTFPITPVSMSAIIMGLYVAVLFCYAQYLPVADDKPMCASRSIVPILLVFPVLLTAVLFKTDYQAFGVSLIFMLYLAKPENKITRSIVLTAGVVYQYGLSIIATRGDFVNGVFVVTERFLNQRALMSFLFALISVILVFLYNGQEGKKIKWAFYVFYPAHIALLAGIWLFLK